MNKKESLMRGIQNIIFESDLDDTETLQKKIATFIEKETNVLNDVFYNPLLKEEYNTLTMIETRKIRYLTRFQNYVKNVQQEQPLKTYGKAKEFAVKKLIYEFINKLQEVEETPKKANTLYFDLKLFSAFFSKYTNPHDGMYAQEYAELIEEAIACKDNEIKRYFNNLYC
ncbi:MAG: hypothetical protein PHE89_07950 [Alphaproteobacteria bacterium]|nr:hypothetical protein [Alphaproteobacteria bacterium]